MPDITNCIFVAWSYGAYEAKRANRQIHLHRRWIWNYVDGHTHTHSSLPNRTIDRRQLNIECGCRSVAINRKSNCIIVVTNFPNAFDYRWLITSYYYWHACVCAVCSVHWILGPGMGTKNMQWKYSSHSRLWLDMHCGRVKCSYGYRNILAVCIDRYAFFRRESFECTVHCGPLMPTALYASSQFRMRLHETKFTCKS